MLNLFVNENLIFLVRSNDLFCLKKINAYLKILSQYVFNRQVENNRELPNDSMDINDPKFLFVEHPQVPYEQVEMKILLLLFERIFDRNVVD